jgi:hypothetical protein
MMADSLIKREWMYFYSCIYGAHRRQLRSVGAIRWFGVSLIARERQLGFYPTLVKRYCPGLELRITA